MVPFFSNIYLSVHPINTFRLGEILRRCVNDQQYLLLLQYLLFPANVNYPMLHPQLLMQHLQFSVALLICKVKNTN